MILHFQSYLGNIYQLVAMDYLKILGGQQEEDMDLVQHVQ